MKYNNTWFSKHPMTMRSGLPFGKHYWLHHYVEVYMGKGFEPMNKKNKDGSITILGVRVARLTCGFSFGGNGNKGLQQSLSEHAEKLKAAGATILKHTKNQLIARHGDETAFYVISPLLAETFYKHLDS